MSIELGDPLRNRTIDLLLTIGSTRRPGPSTCTNSTIGRSECPDRTEHTTPGFHDGFHGQLPIRTPVRYGYSRIRYAVRIGVAASRCGTPSWACGRPRRSKKASTPPDRRERGVQPGRHPARPAHRRSTATAQPAPYGSVWVDINCAA